MNIPRKIMISVWGLLATGLILIPGTISAGNLNMALLSEKTAQVDRMREKIKSGYDQAVDIRRQVNHMTDRLTGEIQKEISRHNITEFSQARRSSRIQYNLELVRKLHAIGSHLDGKIAFFQVGMNRLAYFSRQLQDDVMILTTVGKMAADTLIDEINLTLDAYATATGGFMIDAGDLPMENLEKTWRRCL